MNVIISNKYKDVLSTLQIDVIKSLEGVYDASDIVDNFSNFYFERMILDITSLQDYKNIENLRKISIALDMNKVILLLDDDPEFESNIFLSKIISMGIYNFTRNLEGVKYLLEHPHQYKDVAHLHNINDVVGEETGAVGRAKIIGIKNLTEHAGATTLTWVMKKCLMNNYSVVAMEVDKKDFTYLNDTDLISTTSDNLPKELMKNSSTDVILVDINEYNDLSLFREIIYLIEPGTLSLNRLLRRNKRVFERLKDKKIVLNRSLLNQEDITNFEYESQVKIFHSIPPIDERSENFLAVNKLLLKLGFSKQYVSKDEDDNPGGGIKNKLNDILGI